ncbi:Methyltransferase domain protein [Synechococcus sp. MIT S9509]|uniref:class I SAM-dependent methyltransferase n=1 Tax=unclassified Synechococcus TaxID=2626047 RepID=UPI0007BBAD5C|nr:MULTISPECIES: class I SAM-dependent methyltransferase [unclassified Synechococcus]KZR86307.1 Methyltransferase domain protein [Synechococcus sp. MIT S9504]KZR93555.1 Methyltransferase domain protein [Synechococcus sp. MIT S9509]
MSQSLHDKIVETFHVSPFVHEEDFLLKFLQQCLLDDEKAFQHYFDNGRQSASRIKEIILRNQQPQGISTIDVENFSILDFASGFGMVNRHFSQVIPQAHVEACDIHPKAIDFHSQYLQLKCHASSYDPKKLAINKTFDVVVALSFFSHIPSQSWLFWLQSLCNLLNEGGLLIFTTHGPSSRVAVSEKFIDKGLRFYFYPESEQDDLEKKEYGTACAHPSFSMKIISQLPGMHLSEYKQGIWWGGNQDVYVLVKKSVREQGLLPAFKKFMRRNLSAMTD